MLGPPYRRLLRSAGATEDLFVTRELHQEPPLRIPTGHTEVIKDQYEICIGLTPTLLVEHLFIENSDKWDTGVFDQHLIQGQVDIDVSFEINVKANAGHLLSFMIFIRVEFE